MRDSALAIVPELPPQMQRTRGAARVALRQGHLRDLRQSGAAKAFLPRVHASAPEVVFLNTAGGLTGGDRLDYRLDVTAGTAVATTQTAERAYRALDGTAGVTVRLGVKERGFLSWLPQETIIFEGASIDRTTDVEMGSDDSFLMAEILVLGRAAMGETVTRCQLSDRRRVVRGGVTDWRDPVVLNASDLTAGSAGLAGARAIATVAFFAPGAEDALAPVRRLLDAGTVRAFASAWNGRLIVRATADDGFPLKRAVARLIELLRGAPVPRVWQT
ncbi:MAG: urease accessory protein UreD [Pseudomonadota bacterium]